MRIRYDDVTKKKIQELIAVGKTNSEICTEFGVDDKYTSLISKVNRYRREMNTPDPSKKPKDDTSKNLSGLVSVGVLPDKSSKEVQPVIEGTDTASYPIYVETLLKECKSSSDCLQDVVLSKLAGGFMNIELEMMTRYSKQLKDIICSLENIQFLFDNIDSIRKEK